MKVIIQTPKKEVRIKGIRTQIGFIPEGTKKITENGKHDVFNYEFAEVAVPPSDYDGSKFFDLIIGEETNE